MNGNGEKPLKELGDFLRQSREQVEPGRVGVRHGGIRRTPGLRREEVAQLVGISTAWYTRLEQGYDIRPSLEILERIARVLHLDYTSKTHLFTLARSMPRIVPPSLDDVTRQALQRIIENHEPYPAYLIGHDWDIMLWNQAACRLFGDFAQMQPRERNLIYAMFTSETLQQRMVDWATHARNLLKQFRADYTRLVSSSYVNQIIEMLNSRSNEFREWWQLREIGVGAVVRQEIHHPTAGHLTLEQSIYQVNGAPGFRLVLFIALDEQSRTSLHRLAGLV